MPAASGVFKQLAYKVESTYGTAPSASGAQSLRRVTPQQVQAVAARWFSAEQMTQATLVPDREALAQRQQSSSQRPRLDSRH